MPPAHIETAKLEAFIAEREVISWGVLEAIDPNDPYDDALKQQEQAIQDTLELFRRFIKDQ